MSEKTISLDNLGTFKQLADALYGGNLAPAYSASSTYAVGDLCSHEGGLYSCSTAIASAEAWNAAHWARVIVSEELAAKLNAADYVVDSSLSALSENPVQNKVIKGALDEKVNISDATDIAFSGQQTNNASLLQSITVDNDPYNILPVRPSDATKPYTLEQSVGGDLAWNEKINNLAPEYDSTATYSVGDLVIHEGMLYQCSAAINPAEAWDATHWTRVMVETELAGKQAEIDSTLDMLAPEYDASAAYDIGDVVIYQNALYKCNTAIAAPGEAWDSTHWDSITLGEQLAITQNSLQTGEVDLDFNAADSVSVDSTETLKNVVLGTSSGTTKYTVPSYSRQTPASGGTAVSLVNTGDMYAWNSKQDALTHVSVSASNLESTILGIIGSNRANMWKIVSIYAYGNASSTATYEALSLKIEDDATDPDNPVTTFSLYKGDGTAITSPYTGYTFHIVHM